MAQMTEYKCPACGGAMEFDSASQKMKCPYCDTEMDIDSFESQQADASAQQPSEQTNWEAGSENQGQWSEGETDSMKIYCCQSCGGEIVADDATGATSCPFCGNQVVMKGQFEGDLRPDYIIPFKLDKKAAKEAYMKHLTGKAFLPKVFKDQNHIDEIKGIYVPFWLFDMDAAANITYKGERTRIYRVGDTEYTEHDYYNVQRAGNIAFDRIPADGSRKMDDAMMESIEPFNFEEAVPFKAAYLAGYVADRYDVDMQERITRATERVKTSAEESFRKTVTGYDVVTTQQSNVNLTDAKYWYALYPVWILNTSWKDQKFTFAMNAQTGKMVGDLPADNGAFWRFVGIATPIMSVASYLVIWLCKVLFG